MFSVVIPLYNKEISIGNTIQSVLNQTFQDFEIVIVNDGSTDNSLQVVEQINDSRIRIINKPNGGVSSARNRGIKEAKYDWIAFLDGDDLWENDHLKEIVRMMSLFPDEKVFATSFEYSNNRIMFKHPRETEIFIVNNYFKEALRENLIWTSIVVIHKICFIVSGLFNEQISRGEDLDMWARLAREYNFVKSSIVTAVYRIDSENRAFEKKMLYEESIISKMNFINISKDEKRYKQKLIFDRLKHLIILKDFRSIWKTIIKYNVNLLK